GERRRVARAGGGGRACGDRACGGRAQAGGRRDGGDPGRGRAGGRDHGRSRGVLGQRLRVARIPLLLQPPRLALDVVAEEGMHEEGEVEGGGGEVAREEQDVDRLAHLLDLGVARGGIGGERPLKDL